MRAIFSFLALASVVSGFASSKFQALKSTLPKDLDVVSFGGWHALDQLADDPKGELVRLIVSNLKGTDSSSTSTVGDDDSKLNALVALLQACGKGFNSKLVDGEWSSVLSRQSRKSPKFQKAFARKKAKKGQPKSDFNVQTLTFSGTDYAFRGLGEIRSFVKYNPVRTNFDVGANGDIVLRRIGCDIIGASWKFWKLPTLPLPLKIKGGYLDFLYLDEDIRVTKGNRGGLFIHFRPEFLAKVME